MHKVNPALTVAGRPLLRGPLGLGDMPGTREFTVPPAAAARGWEDADASGQQLRLHFWWRGMWWFKQNPGPSHPLGERGGVWPTLLLPANSNLRYREPQPGAGVGETPNCRPFRK